MAPDPTGPTPTTPYIPGFAAPLGSSLHLAERLLDARIVVVGGQIDDTLANTVCSQLLILDDLDRGRDISLYINSPGGSVDAGFAIYDTMRSRAATSSRWPWAWRPRWGSSCWWAARRGSASPCATARS